MLEAIRSTRLEGAEDSPYSQIHSTTLDEAVSHVVVLLAKWLVSLTSVREVPGTIPTGSSFFCAGTHGIGYSWPGMRVKCIQYTVSSVLLGIRARSDVDVK